MLQKTSATFRKIADNGRRWPTTGDCAVRDGARVRGSNYPRRSPLRRGFDAGCSISQNIQTKAVPRQTTTARNSNVSAGAVSMFNIPDAMQAAYQRTQSTAASI
jgi:hypothetical protein